MKKNQNEMISCVIYRVVIKKKANKIIFQWYSLFIPSHIPLLLTILDFRRFINHNHTTLIRKQNSFTEQKPKRKQSIYQIQQFDYHTWIIDTKHSSYTKKNHNKILHTFNTQ